MKKEIQFKGQLRLYMQWPAIMMILLVAMNIWIYQIDKKAGFVMTAFVLIYGVIVGILYFYNKSLLLSELVEFAGQYGAECIIKGIVNTVCYPFGGRKCHLGQ